MTMGLFLRGMRLFFRLKLMTTAKRYLNLGGLMCRSGKILEMLKARIYPIAIFCQGDFRARIYRSLTQKVRG